MQRDPSAARIHQAVAELGMLLAICADPPSRPLPVDALWPTEPELLQTVAPPSTAASASAAIVVRIVAPSPVSRSNPRQHVHPSGVGNFPERGGASTARAAAAR